MTSPLPAELASDGPSSSGTSSSGSRSLGSKLAGIVRRRALLRALVSRDVRERYIGTSLGMSWIFMQPALLIAFYTFIFSVVFKVRTGVDAQQLTGVQGHGGYALFLMGGLIPWLAFAEAVSRAARSIIGNKAIITKIVFPVELLPISSVLAAQVGLLATLAVALLIAIFSGALAWTAIFTLALLPVLALFSLGLGYILAVISTFFRDVSNLLPFVLNLWMYATPILYSRQALPGSIRAVMGLNPMAPVVEAFRWALIGGAPPDPLGMAYAAGAAVISFLVGFWMFGRAQALFAEVL